MIKTIVADGNIQSRELIISHLKNIPTVVVEGYFDNIFSICTDLKEIDLIIFDINSQDCDKILENVKILKDKFSNINFIALSYEVKSELAIKTFKAGAKEFLIKPIIPSILEGAIKKIEDIKNNVNQNNSRVISVFSNKGGVGKTSVAVNLAYEISKIERNNVCLLDFSFNTDDVSTFLNITPKYKSDYVLNRIETSDKDMLLSLLNNYKNSNLYVLPLQENMRYNVKFTPKNAVKVVNSLKNIFSKIIIDTSCCINEVNTSILYNSDLILLIGLMNLSGVKSCQKCFELFDNLDINNDKIKLIMNRFVQNPDFTIQDIEKTLGKKVYGKIPNNYLTIVDAVNSGLAVGESNPQSNIAKAYKTIARQIADEDFENLNNQRPYNHGILNLIKRIGE